MRKLLSLALAIVMLLAVASNLFACSFEMRDPMNPTANPNRGEKVTSENRYEEHVKPPVEVETDRKEEYYTKEPEYWPEDPVVEVYTVTFKLEGSQYQPEPQKLMHGEYAYKPDVWLEGNQEFDGIWYLDPSCNEEYRYDFDMPVYEELVLYARVDTVYNVTFVVEGNSDQPEPQKVLSDKLIEYPEFVVDEYCTFDGNWYWDPDYTKIFSADTPIKENMTLYAKVTRDPNAPAMILDAHDAYSGIVNGPSWMVNYNEIEILGTHEYIRLFPTGGDPSFMLLNGVQATLPNYMAISYRTNSTLEGEFFIGSGTGPTGAGDHLRVDWNEGEWSLIIIDLSATGLTSINENVINYLRMDFLTGENYGDYFDFEYIAFFDSPEAAEAFHEERHKAPMWDEYKDVVIFRSFDELQVHSAGERIDNIFTPGQAMNWDHVANLMDFGADSLAFWGWIGAMGELGQFGYQINGGTPVYDDAWTVEAEEPVWNVVLGMGAEVASRMKIFIPLNGLSGEGNVVRTLYRSADGAEACLAEFVVNMPDLAFDPEYEASDGTLRYAKDVEQGYCYVVGVEYNGETKIAIPFSFEGLKVIGIANDAFANCQYITTVSMSESIAVIGERAFSGCTSLVSIKLSESISEIPWAAFEGCTSLQTIRIPEGVTYIDGYAFASCTSLRTLHLPNSLIKIDDHVIQDCYSLTRIDYAGTEARWNVIVKGVELGLNSGHYTVNFNYTY